MQHMARGFTLIELAVVIAVVGLLLVPLTHLLKQTTDKRQQENTRTALENARDALLNYAAAHKGCLPHAADFEGGVINTNAAGIGGAADTGSVRAAVEPAGGGSGQRAGDMPWADMGAPAMALDGRQLRIQYYVAAAYTSPTQTRMENDNAATRDDCAARVRMGIEAWDNTVSYQQGDVVAAHDALYVALTSTTRGLNPPNAQWQLFAGGSLSVWHDGTAYVTGTYVAQDNNIYRALADNTAIPPATAPAQWRAVGVAGYTTFIPAWLAHATQGYRRGELVMHEGRVFRAISAETPAMLAPVAGTNGPSWRDISLPFFINGTPKSLETRVGPVIDENADGQNSVASAHNVFVLIATGTDRNALLDRVAVRDANHRTCSSAISCAPWLSMNDENVDGRSFSLTADQLASPTSADEILAVSFAAYQTALQQRGLNARPLGY